MMLCDIVPVGSDILVGCLDGSVVVVESWCRGLVWRVGVEKRCGGLVLIQMIETGRC